MSTAAGSETTGEINKLRCDEDNDGTRPPHTAGACGKAARPGLALASPGTTKAAGLPQGSARPGSGGARAVRRAARRKSIQNRERDGRNGPPKAPAGPPPPPKPARHPRSTAGPAAERQSGGARPRAVGTHREATSSRGAAAAGPARRGGGEGGGRPLSALRFFRSAGAARGVRRASGRGGAVRAGPGGRLPR